MSLTVFIDESGDAGMKMIPGSSSHFVIVTVIFQSGENMARTTFQIQKLKRMLHIKEGEEFKFNKSKAELRKTFLRAMMPNNFVIKALIIDKRTCTGSQLKTDQGVFYRDLIKRVLQSENHQLSAVSIKIDGNGGRLFAKEFITILRKELAGRIEVTIKDVRFIDSHKEPLIQLADMVAGSLFRFYAHGDSTYRDILADKVENEWIF